MKSAEIVASFKLSELSRKQFCKKMGIYSGTLDNWIAAGGNSEVTDKTKKKYAKFIKKYPQYHPDTDFESDTDLPSAHSVDNMDREQLAQLIEKHNLQVSVDRRSIYLYRQAVNDAIEALCNDGEDEDQVDVDDFSLDTFESDEVDASDVDPETFATALSAFNSLNDNGKQIFRQMVQ